MKKQSLIIVLSFLLANSLVSQVNTDSIFQVAIEYSKNKNYDKALANAKTVFSIHPERNDVSIFIANVYAWEKNTDSAKIYIDKANSINPRSNELYDSWLNILLWNKEYDQLIKTANLAAENGYENTYNLTLKRMIAYQNLGEFDDAFDLFLDEENKKYLDSTQIRIIYNELLLHDKQNILTAFYSIDFFNNNDPSSQHLAFIDYAIKIKQNSLIVRANYARRFDENGVQIELDYYQILKNNQYLYFNAGYGIYNDVFPKYRAGAEYFFPLKRNWEASVGARYMYFTTNHVPIITGHIAKYWKSYWFSFRPYYSIEKQGNALTALLNIRKYGKTPLSYWGLEMGFGNSPDERYILDPTGDYFRLNSYRIKLEKNWLIGNTDDIRLSFGYAYEETTKSVYRNRYTIEIIYKHRF